MIEAHVDIEPLRRWCQIAVSELPWKVARRLLSTIARRIARQLRDTVRQTSLPPRVRQAAIRVAGWRFDRGRGAVIGFIRMPRGEHRISARNVHWLVLGTGDRYTRHQPRQYRGRMQPYLKGLLPHAIQKSWRDALAEGESIAKQILEEIRATAL